MKSILLAGCAAAIGLALGPAAKADDQMAATIKTLPPALSVLYEGAPQAIQPSAYDHFTPPPKPWKWCHSESYQGNPWRVAVTNELRRLVQKLIDRGIVSSFEVSDSNGDVSQQINQIRALIDKKCTI
ncbi:MAG TPA: hypothetical protein VHX12_11160, partial [Acidisoma sp.]|nr:hypothetical protein [Acidisoma sp.]